MINVPLNLGNDKKCLIIDANALMHRAYYALPRLKDKQGKLVNAIYGFLACLLKILRDQNPQYVVAVFDSPGKTFRHLEYPLYKATRTKTPDEFYAQFPETKEILKFLGIPVLEKIGYEADDLIGAMAHKVKDPKTKVLILTGDFDLLQLVNTQVNVLLLRKGVSQTALYNTNKTREKLGGLAPKKILDFKGLAGDSSDNIPGVPGVGPKTTLTLLQKFGSLEEIYTQMDKKTEEIKPSLKIKLQKFRDQAFLSKKLATLKTDMKLDLSVAKCSRAGYNKTKVVEILEGLGFNTLIARLP
jgi:DNA polymerase-1